MNDEYKTLFLIDGENESIGVYPTVINELWLKEWDIITKNKVTEILKMQEIIDLVECLL